MLTEQTPEQRAAELRAKAEAAGLIQKDKPPEVIHEFDPELIPQVDDRPEHPLKEQIHAALGSQPIVTANNRWGRSPLKRVSRDESNKVTCPNPAHKDVHQSAWICISKNVFACAVCANNKHSGKYGGGDVFDLASFHFGLNPGTQFVELLEAMASDLGLAVVKRASGLSTTEIPESVKKSFPLAVVRESPEDKEDKEDSEELDPYAGIPAFPIDVFPAGTVARRWCDLLREQSDWHMNFIGPMALILLGTLGAEQVYYVDDPCVTAKFHICMVGDSSTGKSRPINVLMRLLADVRPFNKDTGTGVLQFMDAASGPALLEKFAFTTGTPPEPVSVNGLFLPRELQDIYTKNPSDQRKNTIISLSDWFRHTYDHWMRSKEGRFTAYRPFCQIATTTQPNFMHEFLGSRDVYSGALGRWLFAVANADRIEDKLKTHIDLANLPDLYRKNLAWCATERQIDIEAYRPGYDAFHELYTKFKSVDTLYDSPLLGRTGLNLKRILTALCVNDMSSIANEDIVTRTGELIPFFLHCAQHVDEKLVFDTDTDYQSRILAVRDAFYKKNTRWPTQREVSQRLGSRYKNKNKLVQAYQTLERTGELLLFDPPGQKTTGRPPTRVVGPGVDETTEVRG